jgi:hypothetical protein
MSRMQQLAKLTSNAGETDLESLLSNDAVFVIPYFQRPYRWKPEKLKKLEQDLLNLVDGTSDVHFLGAVIIHGRRGNPSDPKFYEVIDGQQRITTVFVYICAIIRVFCKRGRHDDAAGLFSKYVAITRQTQLSSNSRLHSCKDDRAQLNSVIQEILDDQELASRLGPFSFVPLPVADQSIKGRLRNNFKAAVRFIDDQADEEPDLKRVHAILDALVGRCTVVQIDVTDPASGPKIFDSLNSSQEPMTIGDLVRNEIFSKVANREPRSIEAIDASVWQPFANRFKVEEGRSLFDEYFFPYGLIQDPNVRKTDVYAKLREIWKQIERPEEIIRSLERFQIAFLDLETDGNRQGFSAPLREGFHRLHRSRAPTATYPFLMQLSNALKEGSISEADGVEVLRVLESFLVRRAICGHEPTGLHAVFKRLWQDCEERPTAASVSSAIRRHKTVTWPTDDEVRKNIQERPLYESGICRHLLYSWCEEVGGDLPVFNDKIEIEHVLPQNPNSDWFEGGFERESFEASLDLIGNLLLVTKAVNLAVSNEAYEVKRPIYSEESGYKATRDFAKEFSSWTPKDLASRGERLSAWAIRRWSH